MTRLEEFFSQIDFDDKRVTAEQRNLQTLAAATRRDISKTCDQLVDAIKVQRMKYIDTVDSFENSVSKEIHTNINSLAYYSTMTDKFYNAYNELVLNCDSQNSVLYYVDAINTHVNLLINAYTGLRIRSVFNDVITFRPPPCLTEERMKSVVGTLKLKVD